jgi:transposase-like protein
MEVLQAEGHSMGEIAKRFEVSEQSLDRWRNQFGGMTGEDMKRLVADLALDNRMLKDLAEGNF